MIFFRRADPPREIEEETDRLLDKWANSDTPLSFEEYRFKYASEKTRAYLEIISSISDEGDQT
jgi:hypothetical protein